MFPEDGNDFKLLRSAGPEYSRMGETDRADRIVESPERSLQVELAFLGALPATGGRIERRPASDDAAGRARTPRVPDRSERLRA